MSSRTSILRRSAIALLLLTGVSCRHGIASAIEPPSVRLASDTIRLGTDFEGDVLGSRSRFTCFSPQLFWTWTMSEVRLSGTGAAPRVGACGPRHFRSRIGTLSPMLRPDEPWAATYYRVVACSPDGEPWRKVIVMMVPASSIGARYGAVRMAAASADSYAQVISDSAKQDDRRYCDTRRP